MKIKIISNEIRHNLDDSQVMNNLNAKLGNEISWNYEPQEKILNIYVEDEVLKAKLLNDHKDFIEILPENSPEI